MDIYTYIYVCIYTTSYTTTAHLDCVFVRVADVYGLGVVAVHEPNEAVDEVVHVLEGARLLPRAVDGDVLALQSLEFMYRYI